MKRRTMMANERGRLVMILGLCGFVSAADNWFVSPSLPAIAMDFGISAAAMGAILTAYMIPYGAMQPVYGFFSDRFSKKKLLRVIVLGLSIGTAGGAFSNSLTALCMWRVLTGFFAAGIIAVSLAFIGECIPQEQRQTYVGRFMGIVFAGQGISAGFGGMLTSYISWRSAFIFFAVLGVCAMLLLGWLPDTREANARTAENAQTEGNLKAAENTQTEGNLEAEENTQTEGNLKAEENAEAEYGFFYRLRSVTVDSSLGRVLFPFAFVAGFLILGVYGYIGSYLHERVGLDFLQCGLVVMCYGFACLLGGRQVGAMGRRWGKRRVILCGEGFAILSTTLLILSGTWVWALLATICLGLGYIGVQSTLATLAFDVSVANKGLSSGLIGLGLFCGGGMGSWVGGLVLSKLDYSQMYLFFEAGLLTLFLLTLYSSRFLKRHMIK